MRKINRPLGRVLESHIVALAARLGALSRRRAADEAAWSALEELNGLALAVGADLAPDQGRLRRVYLAAAHNAARPWAA